MSSSYKIFLEKKLIVYWFIRKLRPCVFAAIEIHVNSAGLQIIQKKDGESKWSFLNVTFFIESIKSLSCFAFNKYI